MEGIVPPRSGDDSRLCHAEMCVQIHAREVSQRMLVAAEQHPAACHHLLMAPGAQERHGAAVDEAPGRKMYDQSIPIWDEGASHTDLLTQRVQGAVARKVNCRHEREPTSDGALVSHQDLRSAGANQPCPGSLVGDF